MDKDFYKDLEKIKTIGSTYMAAVGLTPAAGTRVSIVQGYLLCVGLGPDLLQRTLGHWEGPHIGVGFPLHWIRKVDPSLSCHIAGSLQT